MLCGVTQWLNCSRTYSRKRSSPIDAPDQIDREIPAGGPSRPVPGDDRECMRITQRSMKHQL